MILRLMVILYSWVWNVPIWNPQSPEDWLCTLLIISFMDFPIIALIVLAIGRHIDKRKE